MDVLGASASGIAARRQKFASVKNAKFDTERLRHHETTFEDVQEEYLSYVMKTVRLSHPNLPKIPRFFLYLALARDKRRR